MKASGDQVAMPLSHYGNNGYYKDCSRRGQNEGPLQEMNEKSGSFYGGFKRVLYFQ